MVGLSNIMAKQSLHLLSELFKVFHFTVGGVDAIGTNDNESG